MTARDLDAIYDAKFFAEYDDPAQVKDIRRAADGLVDVFLPKSVVDVGCGPGLLLARLKEKGVDHVWGIDGSMAAIDASAGSVGEDMSVFDLTEPATILQSFAGVRTYELVVCTEVAEHIPAEHADTLVRHLAELCEDGGHIAFSAAPPGQGGHDHCNEQPLYPYWVDKFAKFGFAVDEDKTPALRRAWSGMDKCWWYAQNAVVFRRSVPYVLEHVAVLKIEDARTRDWKVCENVVGETCDAVEPGGVVEHFWQSLPGGVFTFPDFYSWVVEKVFGAHRPVDPILRLVEVGVFGGQSAAYLAVEALRYQKARGRDPYFTLDLVDSSADYPLDKAVENLAPVRSVIGKAHSELSHLAARHYDDGSLDFVFIDASHLYEDVGRDIDSWLPKVKIGGTIAGHDFTDWPGMGVVRAVSERFERCEVFMGNSTAPGAHGRYWPCWSVTVTGQVLETWRARGFGKEKAVRTDLVSVVVPCHEQSQYLVECLESLRRQTYGYYEVVIVTGDDESLRVASEWQRQYEKDFNEGREVRIVSGMVKGRADAVNAGAAFAKGRYVCTIDADDWVDPDFLEKMVAASPDGERYSLVTCSMERFGKRSGRQAIGLAGRPRTAELSENFFLVCSLFTRELWSLVGGLENSIFGYEDWDFWIKLSQRRDVHLGEVPEYLFHYRVHDGQGSTFCYENDAVLKACMHLLHIDFYGAPRAEDIRALATCSLAAKEKLLERAEWFPGDDRVGVRIFRKILLDDKIRAAFEATDQARR